MQYVKGMLPVVILGLLLVPSGAWSARPAPCPDLLFPDGECAEDVGAAIAACCPCDDVQFRNHGRYVRCVAHSVNALRRAGCLDRDQRRTLKKCAARSTCNKPASVRCCIERPGVCDAGVCAKTDPPVSCEVSEECPPRTKCKIKRGVDIQDAGARCAAKGGIPSGTGSCCDACGN
jgi:hypothetical protein